MYTQKHKILTSGIVLLTVCVVGTILYTQTMKNQAGVEVTTNKGLEQRQIFIGDVELQVEVAKTQQERVIGLSNRQGLPNGRGMLFIFDHAGDHSIWMKDMLFSIDIIWISSKNEVVHIFHEVSPETYPKLFSSPIKAQYVLEVPSGYARNKISVGDKVVLGDAH